MFHFCLGEDRLNDADKNSVSENRKKESRYTMPKEQTLFQTTLGQYMVTNRALMTEKLINNKGGIKFHCLLKELTGDDSSDNMPRHVIFNQI